MNDKIKNGDLPAMPLTGDAYTDFAHHLNKAGSYAPECLGMTKFEEMVTYFMAARISSPDAWRSNMEQHASASIYAARALLDALEQSKTS